MNRFVKRRTLLLSGFAAALLGPLIAGCKQNESPLIGFSIDDMRVDRWVRDRDFFLAAAKTLGARVTVRSADGDEQRQIDHIANMIERKVDVIVIVPSNAKSLGPVIAKAKQAGIKVVDYDRLILDADLDAFISFDNEAVGVLQGQTIVKAVPKGNYFLLAGAQTDHNAKVFREGQMKAIQPYVASGDIKIVGDEWVKDWNPNEALAIINQALSVGTKIDAIVASNDGTAGGAIEALAKHGLAGKVSVSGQDCELDACKRVIAGTQTMTIYKPLKLLAEEAARTAVALVHGTQINFNSKLANGLKDVSVAMLPPTLITKSNIETLVDEGFFSKEQLGLA